MNDAINRLVKGCEIHMNSAILLSKEVQDLRAAHEKNQGKKKRSHQQMAHEEGLTIQEGQDLIQRENEAQEVINSAPTEPASPAVQPRVRAPPRCSDCNTLGHKRTHCPYRNCN